MTQIYPLQHPEAKRFTLRRRVRRVVLVVTAVIVATFLIVSGPNAWRKMRTRLAMESVRRECLRFQRAQDRVVYDDDPSVIEALSESDPLYVVGHFSLSPHGRQIVFYPTDCLQRLLSMGDSDFSMEVISPFVHGRHAGRAVERLVALDLANRKAMAADRFAMQMVVVIIRPIYALYLPDMILHGYSLELPGDSHTPVRFFAGRPDPNDPARFTVRYDLGQQECELEGVLKEDDTVDLRVIRGVGHISAIGSNR